MPFLSDIQCRCKYLAARRVSEYDLGMDVPVTELNRHIAAELRAESARQGYIQKDAAIACGVSQGTMSTKWNGKVPLSVGEFVAWCDLLDMPPGRIVQRAHDSAVDAMARAMIADGLMPRPRTYDDRPLTQSDVAPAAEDRDGTDEADYDA